MRTSWAYQLWRCTLTPFPMTKQRQKVRISWMELFLCLSSPVWWCVVCVDGECQLVSAGDYVCTTPSSTCYLTPKPTLLSSCVPLLTFPLSGLRGARRAWPKLFSELTQSPPGGQVGDHDHDHGHTKVDTLTESELSHWVWPLLTPHWQTFRAHVARRCNLWPTSPPKGAPHMHVPEVA